MSLKQLARYEIIEELARGSMGVIYKAWDPLLDRIVALKTVGADLSADEAEAFERRFYREAKSAGRLNHRNIVTIHDVGKVDSVAYIAMEFLQGRSLREILDSGVVLPLDKIVDIAAQVADGLAFAHESGIVHRDIKPPNIMVLESGTVKITDFGIALLPGGSRTLAGSVFGSPKYMSPEQIVGREVDGRADIFSLGSVLYELLTGFAPFFGGDLETVLDQVINDMPAAPTSRNKSIPAVFDYIVTKALAKHPDDRYADASGLAADLRGFRALQPAGSVPRAQRTLERRMIRRRKGERPPGLSSDTPSSARPPTAFSLRNIMLIGVPAAALFVAGGTFLARLASNHWLSSSFSATNAPITKPAATGMIDANPGGGAVPPGPTLRPVAEFAPETPAASAFVATERVPTVGQTSVKPARTTTTPEAAKPTGRLALAVSPWGEIYVDGKKRGISPPLTELKLAPGKHTIEIRNTTFAPYADTVSLEPNAYVRIKHRFR
jgi:eukaryotic-like serine/threonine-protein kinase